MLRPTGLHFTRRSYTAALRKSKKQHERANLARLPDYLTADDPAYIIRLKRRQITQYECDIAEAHAAIKILTEEIVHMQFDHGQFGVGA